jgi:hypothetical protein
MSRIQANRTAERAVLGNDQRRIGRPRKVFFLSRVWGLKRASEQIFRRGVDTVRHLGFSGYDSSLPRNYHRSNPFVSVSVGKHLSYPFF